MRCEWIALTLGLAPSLFCAPVFGPDVDASLLRVTLYASGISGPQAMQQLSDGSLLIQTSSGWVNGDLLLFQDSDHDGVADFPGTSVFSNTQGPITQLASAGGFFLQGNFTSPSISVLKAGATPDAALTEVGQLTFNYPSPWGHPTQGLAARAIDGQPGVFQVVFNVGAKFDATHSGELVTLNGLGLTDVQVEGESLYVFDLDLNGPTPVASNLRQAASGIRNVFGLQFDPDGNLWFSDNAMDAPSSTEDPPQAEELNRILAADLGNTVVHFGFPTCFTDLSGVEQGSGCTPPVVAFVPQNGMYSQGAAQIAISNQSLPAPFNNGIFIGFSGRGLPDPRNPVLFYDFDTETYIHFILAGSMANPLGLLATGDALYVSDWGAGEVYRITAAIPEPASWTMLSAGMLALLALHRRSKVQRR